MNNQINILNERLRYAVMALNHYNFILDFEQNSFWNEMKNTWSTIVYLKDDDGQRLYVNFTVVFADNSHEIIDCYAKDNNDKVFGILSLMKIDWSKYK